MNASSTLLDEALALALGLDAGARISSAGRIILVEDCVETSGAFVLHHLIKRALSNPEAAGAVLFVALAQPFSHYDRVMRKLGCNLSAQRDNKRLHFFDMLKLECPGRIEGSITDGGFFELYTSIQKALEVSCSSENSRVTIMIDDISLLEIAANGSLDSVLDFLHYCITLTSEVNCSLVMLNHEDIYSSKEAPRLLLHLEYLSDIVVKAEPLTTGLSAEVHGQLTILNKGNISDCRQSRRKIHNFHFKVKENTVDYFYPGGRA